ncbi:MAG: YcaO-like family protein [bacterium]|nr:YcaO-like family protein [bacterium]
MRSRVWKKFFGKVEMPEPTLAWLCLEIKRSRFGDVLAFLAKKKIVSGAMPTPIPWIHTIPKTHYILLNAREELQSPKYTPLYGGGASYDSFAEALSKAIGELLERYVLLTPFFHRKNKIVQRTFGDKHIPRALLYEIPHFFEWQRKYISNGLTDEILKKNESSKAIIHCVIGESLSRGEKVSIPLQHVQWGSNYVPGTFGADTYRISPKTTSGAGGGFTLVDATLSGLCELIERDGFVIYWLNRLSPRRIRIDQSDSSLFSSRFLEVYRSLSDRGYEIYFLDTTTDIRIPSITCLILSPFPDGRKSISVTGKCHSNPVHALEHALLEHTAFLSSPPKETTISISGSEYVPFSDKNIGKKERINMWRSGSMTKEITFFISGKEISFREWANKFPTVPIDQKVVLLHVLEEFARLEKEYGPAYEVFRYEVRHPILEELEYHVVKVSVPALMPLYLSENSALLDSVRLREVPKKLGYIAASVDTYNPLPHPFP